MIRTSGAAVAAFLVCLFSLSGCERAERDDDVSREAAELVSHATAGLVSPDDVIRVRFVELQVDEGVVGVTLSKKLFSFEPEIAGRAYWLDRRTLVFEPRDDLPAHTRYRGELDLAALQGDAGAEILTLRFEAAGMEVSGSEASFSLADPADPARLLLSGSVTLTQTAELERLRQASSLTLERATATRSGRTRAVTLTWEPGSDSRTFRFRSAELRRGDAESVLTLRLDARTLQLGGDYIRAFTVPPLEVMRVVEVAALEEGDRPRLRIDFSDQVDPDADLSGLIALEPPVEHSITVSGRSLYLDGDLEHGGRTVLRIRAGVRSRWGTVTREEQVREIEFHDLKPRIRFSNAGVFAPPANRRKVRFAVLNVARVRLEIKRVFDSNIGQFLQTERLSSSRDRGDAFNESYVQRVGLVVEDTLLETGGARNRWLQNEIDLNPLMEKHENGLYLLSLSFRSEDMLYGTPGEMEAARRNHRFSDYMNDPYSPGYIWAHGRAFKPLIQSDIGLTFKSGHRRAMVFVARLSDAKPLSGVNVTLRSYQNQILARKTTGRSGVAEFEGIDEPVFYVEARREGSLSVVKPSEMAWSLSSFDTGGRNPNPEDVSAFIYTERGVYRPGDSIHVALIARHSDGTFPDRLPVTLKLYNPRDQLVHEATGRDGVDGFYLFPLATAAKDPTGTWRAEFLVGATVMVHPLKIETVAPLRLKVDLTPSSSSMGPADRRLGLELTAAYLFGAAAAGLGAEIDLELAGVDRSFATFPAYRFGDESVTFQPVRETLFKGELDAGGAAKVEWTPPPFERVPSAMRAVFRARVFEKGGRPNPGIAAVDVDPYPRYVGMRRPELEYGLARVGSVLPIDIVLVNLEGEAVAGRPLTVRVYRNNTYWWWEYDSREQFQLRFKTDNQTEQVAEAGLVSASSPLRYEFRPESDGEYLVQVSESGTGGHCAALFVRAAHWGTAARTESGEAELVLRSDKARYSPGERAEISFPAPAEGSILLTVERGAEILSHRWIKPEGTGEEMRVTIPVETDMAPTAYVCVSAIQPHGRTGNDRPLRAYGILPLDIENPDSRFELALDAPETLRPEQRFTVSVRTLDGEPARFTLAAVDEGLLALTRFQTPDPWKFFYQKLRLAVETSDLYAHVIGAGVGELFRTYSIGGGLAGYRESQLGDEQDRRFPPVSLFKGPLRTDDSGTATVQFQLPNTIGAVRLMAVAARGGAYASADRSIPVRSELMVLSSLPRFLGPGDRCEMPVTLFRAAEPGADVDVELEVDGPLRILGAQRQSVSFSGPGERELRFALKAAQAAGPARITVRARDQETRAHEVTELLIRPSSPRIYRSQTVELRPGEEAELTVPEGGLAGTQHAGVEIRRRPHLNIDHRLRWLLNFPYACIEQTVSAAFPQLYIEQMASGLSAAEIDASINAAIARLRSFQLASGAFAYWPGNARPSVWASNYAGHFALEARSAGYHVPEPLMSRWLSFQRRRALSVQDNLLERIYRVYLLSLAGEPDRGALNLIFESASMELSDTQKWLLAAAIRLAGEENRALGLIRDAGLEVRDYQESGGTYGSALRDKAMILSAALHLSRPEIADRLARELSEALSSSSWISTQTCGYMLLALGQYYKSLEKTGDAPPRLRGRIRLPGEEEREFDSAAPGLFFELDRGFGETMSVCLDPGGSIERAFLTLNWDGVPLHGAPSGDGGPPDGGVADLQQGLELEREWLDQDGMAVDPGALAQGSTFWGHFRVKNPNEHAIEEVALVQLLPAGWEIDNTRVSGGSRPPWMRKWALNREEYLDIRDNGVMWFFDLPAAGRGEAALDFVIRINAVTVGDFTLPPVVAEAMYNHSFAARRAGRAVSVKRR